MSENHTDTQEEEAPFTQEANNPEMPLPKYNIYDTVDKRLKQPQRQNIYDIPNT